MGNLVSINDLLIVYGTVNSDGSIACGTGFRVVHEETGLYNILFNTDLKFKKAPTVVATQKYPDGDDFSSDGGNTLDNAVVVAVAKDKFKLVIGRHNGDKADRSFGFTAIGELDKSSTSGSSK